MGMSIVPASRVLIAPDSFKQSATAVAAARATATGWQRARPDDRVECCPMADAGEGTLDALAAASPGSIEERIDVAGPDLRPTSARWLLLPDGTGVVELAETSGIGLMPRLDPAGATTLGLGQALRHLATDPRVTRILVALGGSASTDGGSGALTGLGARLLDEQGDPVPAEPLHLPRVATVDLSDVPPLPPGGVQCLVDVRAPLVGPDSAARQFGPQKGADPALVERLEAALAAWAVTLGGDPTLPGSGAAGGTAFGLLAVGATLTSGSQALVDALDLEHRLGAADVVITGEGRYDAQSHQGKVVGTLLELAARADARPIVVCGSAAEPADRVVELATLAGSPQESMRDPLPWLERAGEEAARRWGALR